MMEFQYNNIGLAAVGTRIGKKEFNKLFAQGIFGLVPIPLVASTPTRGCHTPSIIARHDYQCNLLLEGAAAEEDKEAFKDFLVGAPSN